MSEYKLYLEIILQYYTYYCKNTPLNLVENNNYFRKFQSIEPVQENGKFVNKKKVFHIIIIGELNDLNRQDTSNNLVRIKQYSESYHDLECKRRILRR